MYIVAADQRWIVHVAAFTWLESNPQSERAKLLARKSVPNGEPLALDDREVMDVARCRHFLLGAYDAGTTVPAEDVRAVRNFRVAHA